jgi:hypothetical protein
VSVFNGEVVNGEVVVDGADLPDGTIVRVYVPEDGESFHLTPSQLQALDAAIAGMDRSDRSFDERVLETIRALKRGER